MDSLSLSLGSFCVTRADQTWSKDLWGAGKFNFLYVYTHIYIRAAAAGCRARRWPFSILYIKRGGNMQGCATDAILPITLFSLSQVKFKHVKRVYRKKRRGGETSQLSIQLKNRSRPSKIQKKNYYTIRVSFFALHWLYKVRWWHTYVRDRTFSATDRAEEGKREKKKKKKVRDFLSISSSAAIFFFLSFFWLSV